MHFIVIVFVARVFVHLFFRIDLRPGKHSGPRARPSCRIGDGEFVIDRVRPDAGKPLDKLKMSGFASWNTTPVSERKFVVSTTSVSPSQCPRESPSHWCRFFPTSGRPSSGMMRAL